MSTEVNETCKVNEIALYRIAKGDCLFSTPQTDRLTLRRLEGGDRNFLVALDTDAKVMRSVHFRSLTLQAAPPLALCDIEFASLYRIFYKWLLEVGRGSYTSELCAGM